MNVKYGSAFMAYLPDEALGFPATNNASTTKFNFLLISLPKILVISQKVCYLCTRLKVMEVVAQSVRASVCGTEGRGFETPHPPRHQILRRQHKRAAFFCAYFSGVWQRNYPAICPIGRSRRMNVSSLMTTK